MDLDGLWPPSAIAVIHCIVLVQYIDQHQLIWLLSVNLIPTHTVMAAQDEKYWNPFQTDLPQNVTVSSTTHATPLQ